MTFPFGRCPPGFAGTVPEGIVEKFFILSQNMYVCFASILLRARTQNFGIINSMEKVATATGARRHREVILRKERQKD